MMKTIFKNILAVAFILTSGTILPARRKTTVVIANKSNSSITAHTTTPIPPQTKAEITTTFTNIDIPAVKNDPLLMAIVLKKEDQIEALLKSGPIPDEKVIIFAMDNGLPTKTVELLVKKAGYSNSHLFSNVLSVNKYAFNCVRDVDSYVRLIENGVDFHNEVECSSCCYWPGTHGDVLKLVQAFLKTGYGPNFIVHNDHLRMMCLSRFADEVLDLLFMYGLTQADASWLLFFYIENACIAYNARIAYIEKLLSYGVNVNQRRINNNPTGSDCNTTCNTGNTGAGNAYDQITPLSRALLIRKSYVGHENTNNDKIIEMLISHGAIIVL
jgi:hypothetical protein